MKRFHRNILFQLIAPAMLITAFSAVIAYSVAEAVVPAETGGGFALFALVGDSARGVFHRDRARYPYLQNFLYEESFRHLQRLGMLYEQYRQMAQQLKDQGLERKAT